jgi:hypothetical protein
MFLEIDYLIYTNNLPYGYDLWDDCVYIQKIFDMAKNNCLPALHQLKVLNNHISSSQKYDKILDEKIIMHAKYILEFSSDDFEKCIAYDELDNYSDFYNYDNYLKLCDKILYTDISNFQKKVLIELAYKKSDDIKYIKYGITQGFYEFYLHLASFSSYRNELDPNDCCATIEKLQLSLDILLTYVELSDNCEAYYEIARSIQEYNIVISEYNFIWKKFNVIPNDYKLLRKKTLEYASYKCYMALFCYYNYYPDDFFLLCDNIVNNISQKYENLCCQNLDLNYKESVLKFKASKLVGIDDYKKCYDAYIVIGPSQYKNASYYAKNTEIQINLVNEYNIWHKKYLEFYKSLRNLYIDNTFLINNKKIYNKVHTVFSSIINWNKIYVCSNGGKNYINTIWNPTIYCDEKIYSNKSFHNNDLYVLNDEYANFIANEIIKDNEETEDIYIIVYKYDDNVLAYISFDEIEILCSYNLDSFTIVGVSCSHPFIATNDFVYYNSDGSYSELIDESILIQEQIMCSNYLSVKMTEHYANFVSDGFH